VVEVPSISANNSPRGGNLSSSPNSIFSSDELPRRKGEITTSAQVLLLLLLLTGGLLRGTNGSFSTGSKGVYDSGWCLTMFVDVVHDSGWCLTMFVDVVHDSGWCLTMFVDVTLRSLDLMRRK
jgi:hypothetical protein